MKKKNTPNSQSVPMKLYVVVAGLFLGVTEVLVASHLTSEYKDVISFLILITVLMVLPQGFFGEKIAERL